MEQKEQDLLLNAHLYDHKFDVDDIIRALCGDDHEGRWLLSTRDGTLIQEALFDAQTADIKQGDDDNHWHVITPLPVTYVTELTMSGKMMDLLDLNRRALRDLLGKISRMHHVLPALTDERYGYWLYERLKEESLEWLDEKDLIPPSMHHVRNVGMPGGKISEKLKVEIIS
jgi:hypothetical protein